MDQSNITNENATGAQENQVIRSIYVTFYPEKFEIISQHQSLRAVCFAVIQGQLVHKKCFPLVDEIFY